MTLMTTRTRPREGREPQTPVSQQKVEKGVGAKE